MLRVKGQEWKSLGGKLEGPVLLTYGVFYFFLEREGPGKSG